MTRIRVNTDDLKNKAKDFESAAEAFARAGDDIAAAAMTMPSYDGQLSGPARKAGFEIQSQSRDIKTALTNDALYLQNAAQDFENVDNQAVDAFTQSQESLLLFGISDVWSEGSAYLGYNDDPGTNNLIICMYCVCRNIPETTANEEIRNRFKKAVDDYNLARENMWKAFNIYSVAYATWAALVGAPILAGGVVLPLTFGKIAIAYTAMLTALDTYLGFVEKEKEASADAAAAWNLLPGAPSVNGAERAGPYAVRPCSDKDVYEP
jgi:uncharacterized protein YukE